MTFEAYPVVLGKQRSQLVKVRFELNSDDQTQAVKGENLWAEQLGEAHFRIENTPFYAYGVSYQDIVAAERHHDILHFKRVVSRGGHSTYRILVKDPQGYESQSFVNGWANLAALRCSFEVAKRRWLAVDVPALPDIFAVYRELEKGEEYGVWTFEEGHCGHRVEEIPT